MVGIFNREPESGKRRKNLIQTTVLLTEKFAGAPGSYDQIQQERLASLPGAVWNVLLNENNAPLIERLTEGFEPLESVAKINRGLITGDRKKFFSTKKETSKHVPILAGGDVTRYGANQPGEYVLFERPASAGGCWDPDVHMAAHKILVRQIGIAPMATFIGDPIAVTGNIFTVRGESVAHELFLLAILNSKVTEFFWKTMFADFKSTFPQVTIFSLAQVPIRVIDPKNKTDRARHDQLVALVERMLKLHADVASAKSPDAQNRLQREIKATDTAIDRLVYQLYDLTPDEIALVEAATAPVAKAADAELAEIAPAPGANAQAEVDAAHHYTLHEDPPAKP